MPLDSRLAKPQRLSQPKAEKSQSILDFRFFRLLRLTSASLDTSPRARVAVQVFDTSASLYKFSIFDLLAGDELP
ncbi:hypothetical protein [Microcoleus sp.]|uniref:hypothetical protein n=1 Tax=Microcoleus sp. TaxID=44472 RepID=UPI00359334F5